MRSYCWDLTLWSTSHMTWNDKICLCFYVVIIHQLSRLCNCTSSSIQPLSCLSNPSFLPDLVNIFSVLIRFLLTSLSFPPHLQMLFSLMARGSFSEDPSWCHLSVQGHDTCQPALGEVQMFLQQQDYQVEASWLTVQLLLGLRGPVINAQ